MPQRTCLICPATVGTTEPCRDPVVVRQGDHTTPPTIDWRPRADPHDVRRAAEILHGQRQHLAAVLA